jgi:SAM-dependent methyltransferase
MFQALKAETQITEARKTMLRRGISAVDTAPQRLMRRFGLRRAVQVGDELKSWDVLATIEFIENALARDAPILDIGSYASEVPVSLAKLGYSNVAAIDLNPELRRMPCQDRIRYKIGNFMATPFAPESFAAITATSVIEHGYDPARLLAEVGRLLKPGGYFLASVDYWPEKIETKGQLIFDMNWLIFSKDDILELVSQAALLGLAPCGDLQFSASEPLVRYGGHAYTFGWLALRRSQLK